MQGCHGTSHLGTRNRLPALEGGRQPQCTGGTCAKQRQRGKERCLLQDGQRGHPQRQITRHRDGDADPKGWKHPSHGRPGTPFRLQQCGGQPVHGQIHHHPDQAAAHHQREDVHLTEYQHTACEPEQETDPQGQQDEKHPQAAHDEQQQRQREPNAHTTHPARFEFALCPALGSEYRASGCQDLHTQSIRSCPGFVQQWQQIHRCAGNAAVPIQLGQHPDPRQPGVLALQGSGRGIPAQPVVTGHPPQQETSQPQPVICHRKQRGSAKGVAQILGALKKIRGGVRAQLIQHIGRHQGQLQRCQLFLQHRQVRQEFLSHLGKQATGTPALGKCLRCHCRLPRIGRPHQQHHLLVEQTLPLRFCSQLGLIHGVRSRHQALHAGLDQSPGTRSLKQQRRSRQYQRGQQPLPAAKPAPIGHGSTPRTQAPCDPPAPRRSSRCARRHRP